MNNGAMQIKAAVCREFGAPLVMENLQLAAPRNGELRVKVAACAICQSDVSYAAGHWGGETPVVFGHEAAGVVDAVGSGIAWIQPGDHVIVTLLRSCGRCWFCARREFHNCETRLPLDETPPLSTSGGEPVGQGLRTAAFAEYVVVDASQVVVISRRMSLLSASLLSCGVITGFGAVANTAAVAPHSNVVVVGVGGVGLNCVQGARFCNARTIVAVDISEDKLRVAPSFGATHAVNPETQDTREQVRALSDGRGADYVFVAIGSAQAIEQGVKLLRHGGTLVVVGMTPLGVKARLHALNIADMSQRIIGSKMGSTRLQADVPRLIELYERGALKLDELLSGRYPLERINEAIASSRQGQVLRNVIVF